MKFVYNAVSLISFFCSNAFVKAESWDDGVFGAFGPKAYERREAWPDEDVIAVNYTYSRYFDQCEPKNCHYDERAGGGLLITLLLGLVGGLVPLIAAPISSAGKGLFYLIGVTYEQRLKRGGR
jgi:hypothetical protein